MEVHRRCPSLDGDVRRGGAQATFWAPPRLARSVLSSLRMTGPRAIVRAGVLRVRHVVVIEVATLLVVLGGPGLARADDENLSARTTAVYAETGFGTPLGYFGLEGLQQIAPRWEIAAGVGLGLSAAKNGSGLGHELQWSLMPRYRLGSERAAMTIGLGMSGGNYAHTLESLCGSEEELLDCNLANWRYTLWANTELGGEFWFPTGFAFRFFVGYGHVLAQGAEHCVVANPSCGPDVPGNSFPYYNIPYGGLAFGAAF